MIRHLCLLLGFWSIKWVEGELTQEQPGRWKLRLEVTPKWWATEADVARDKNILVADLIRAVNQIGGIVYEVTTVTIPENT